VILADSQSSRHGCRYQRVFRQSLTRIFGEICQTDAEAG
jgi:hypothetical protein